MFRGSDELTRIPAFCVLVLGVVLTVLTSAYVYRQVSQDEKLRFINAAEEVQSRVSARLSLYESTLYQARAFLLASRPVSRESFRQYVDHLKMMESFPGLQGLGYAVRVSRDELPSHTAEMRRSGLPDYAVWPKNPREEYFSIVYLEPQDWRNRRAIGYDMFTESTRRAAMERARDTGRAAVSGKVTLVQETEVKPQPGFLMYVPVYLPGKPLDTIDRRRAALEGFIYGAFRTHDLFRAIFENVTLPVDFEVFDAQIPGEDGLVYDHNLIERFEGGRSASSRFLEAALMSFGGHVYSLQFRSLPGFELITSEVAPIFVALAGLLVTYLIFQFVWSAGSHARTERKLLLLEQDARLDSELQREKLYSLFMQAPAAICVLRGPNLCFELVNPPYREMVGAHRKLVGRPLKEAIPEFDPSVSATIEQVVRTGKRFIGKEFPMELDWEGSGHPYQKYFNLVYEPIRDPAGQIDGLMTFAFDVTEQVMAIRTRDEFLSICSHELKTPLTSMKLRTQITERALSRSARTSSSPEDIQKLVGSYHQQVNRLTRLVDDMLDVARINTGRMRMEPEELTPGAVVLEVIERFHEEIRATGSSVHLSLPEGIQPTANWDRLRIEQVISNLVSNAIKYGAGRPIHVSVNISGNHTVMTVRDEGIGIAKEDQNRIFHRFERAMSHRSISGLGLGLYIVRQIVLAHEGTIEIDSAPGKGSAFTARIPLRPRSMERAAS